MIAKVDIEGKVTQYEYDRAGRMIRSEEAYREEVVSSAYRRYIEAGYFPDEMMQTAGYEVEGEEYKSILKELGAVYKGSDMEGVKVKRGRNALTFEERAQMGTHRDEIEQAMYELSGMRRIPAGQNVWAEEYEYDGNGNMVVQRNGWGEIEMEYNEKNEMEKRGKREYEYDENGNMVREKMYRMSIVHGYGADNRIRYSESNRAGIYGGGRNISYEYDGLGRRRMRSYTNEEGNRESVFSSYDRKGVEVISEWIQEGYEETEKIETLYAELKELEEGTWYRAPDITIGMKSTERREYSYGQRGELLYAYEHTPQYRGGNQRDPSYKGGVSYTTDMLGSVRTTNSTRGEREEYEYTAFGDMYAGEGSKSYGMAYTGKQEIAGQQGVYNYGYRDYRSVEGRFMTEDPIRDGSNWHIYVSNSPMNFVDPDGLRKLTQDEKDMIVEYLGDQYGGKEINLDRMRVFSKKKDGLSLLGGAMFVADDAMLVVSDDGDFSLNADEWAKVTDDTKRNNIVYNQALFLHEVAHQYQYQATKGGDFFRAAWQQARKVLSRGKYDPYADTGSVENRAAQVQGFYTKYGLQKFIGDGAVNAYNKNRIKKYKKTQEDYAERMRGDGYDSDKLTSVLGKKTTTPSSEAK